MVTRAWNRGIVESCCDASIMRAQGTTGNLSLRLLYVHAYVLVSISHMITHLDCTSANVQSKWVIFLYVS